MRVYQLSDVSLAWRRHLLCSGFITEEGLLSNAKTTTRSPARNACAKEERSTSGRPFGITRHEPHAMAASLVDQELHSDQRTAFDPRLYVLISAEFLMDGGEDGAAPGLIQNGSCPGG
jgi:hypothetical protein